MKTVLITGGIGSGKSEVCRYLQSKGLPVYDSDSGCKRLYDAVPGLKEKIEQALGISFSEISVIFTDSAKREKLESIVYPLLIEDIVRWRTSLESGLCFIESAIALEKPCLDGLYDEVWMVVADLQTRIRRNPKAAVRAAIQSPDTSRADRIINNDSDLKSLYEQIENILE